MKEDTLEDKLRKCKETIIRIKKRHKKEMYDLNLEIRQNNEWNDYVNEK